MMIVRPAEDHDAAFIRKEIEAGTRTTREGLQHYQKAGRRLAAKKAALRHGQWLPWLREHGFNPRMAARYMVLASKCDVTSNLREEEVSQLSAEVWGNVPAKPPADPDPVATAIGALYREGQAHFREAKRQSDCYFQNPISGQQKNGARI
jgi:hypothetical protein